MKLSRCFYLWFLPLAFGLNSVFSFHYPGDEYLSWFVSSLPGMWIAFLKNSGDIKSFQYLAVLGALPIMVLIGWRLDLSKIKPVTWLATMAGVAVPGFCFALSRKFSLPDSLFEILGICLWLGSPISLAAHRAMRNWNSQTQQAS